MARGTRAPGRTKRRNRSTVLVVISIRAALAIAGVCSGYVLAQRRAGKAINRRELAAYMDGFRVAAGG